MTPAQRFRTIASGVALLGIAVGSAALTLGRVQGVAWVGRPLDVQVTVQADTSEDLQVDCLFAEVLYGDTQLDASRVSVSLAPAGNRPGAGQSVRIVTTTVVDEPVVTVLLRAGCGQRSSRRFTLLADLPTNVVEAAVPVVPALARTDAPRVAPMNITPRPAGPGVSATAPLAGPLVAARKPRAAKAVVPPPVAAPTERVTTARHMRPASRARLKLDPLDALIERDPVLRATSELLTVPQDGEGGSQRAEAAAVWRSLNASAEEVMRDEAKAQALEKDIQSLVAVTTANQKNLIELAGKVQKAESERYANGLVYGLIALWVVCLAALVWVWQRMRSERTPDWAEGLDGGDSVLGTWAVAQAEPVPDPVVPVVPAPVNVVPETGLRLPLTEVDFDLDLIESPWNEHLRDPEPEPELVLPSRNATSHAGPRSPRADAVRDFSVSVSPGMRSIDSEELVDTRQQAEFFVSLGQHEKAIGILTTRVAQCGESSPLVCLDLLKIYHSLGRQAEFEFMRTEFNHWFAGRVPEFAAFGKEGRALERYPDVMERIVALWPSPQVLEYIEGCIYHQTGDSDGVVFDLQAYLDLLFLHGVAKRIVRQSGGPQDDDNMSELLRIPPRAAGLQVADLGDPGADPAAPHRAGAQFRGAWLRNPAEPQDDPELERETRASPLGAMRLPPTARDAAEPVDTAPAPDADRRNLTDFNFLGLR